MIARQWFLNSVIPSAFISEHFTVSVVPSPIFIYLSVWMHGFWFYTTGSNPLLTLMLRLSQVWSVDTPSVGFHACCYLSTFLLLAEDGSGYFLSPQPWTQPFCYGPFFFLVRNDIKTWILEARCAQCHQGVIVHVLSVDRLGKIAISFLSFNILYW